MRISDWSSDVCSSDLASAARGTGLRRRTRLREGRRGAGLRLVQSSRSGFSSPLFQTVEIGGIAYLLRYFRRGQEAQPHCLFYHTLTRHNQRQPPRSEEHRVGKEGGSTWRSRWSAYHKKKNKKK